MRSVCRLPHRGRSCSVTNNDRIEFDRSRGAVCIGERPALDLDLWRLGSPFEPNGPVMINVIGMAGSPPSAIAMSHYGCTITERRRSKDHLSSELAIYPRHTETSKRPRNKTFLVSPLGLEPRTKRLKVSCSNQLSYGPGRWIPPCPALVYWPPSSQSGCEKREVLLARNRSCPRRQCPAPHPNSHLRR